ncbi:MAG: NAD(P)H-dependent glycerol-3-phosphate dehydrogenase [Pseudomonadota bacterium]|nr:NAD(P)H-dependent glycerol-3-phosphate dehydrogenase [Pseudomonadota bacterium]
MSDNSRTSLTVLGAGSWGTALALVLARNEHPVSLWCRDADQAQEMAALRCNGRYLPAAVFPRGLQPTADFGEALSAAANVLIAVPSHAFREVVRAGRDTLRSAQRIAWATKGLEPDTLALLGDVLRDELGGRGDGVVISGPSFAKEVALGLPTAMTAASHDETAARWWAERFTGRALRLYTSNDPVGVQIGGAVKNVLAIAAGISDGLGFGANARAALITRGLAEMRRHGEAMGASEATFLGLAGAGDLMLTCTDDQSRNRRAGLALARGRSRDQAADDIGQVVEGFGTVRSVKALAARHGVEMPISEAVYAVVYEQASPRDVVADLLERGIRAERGRQEPGKPV